MKIEPLRDRYLVCVMGKREDEKVFEDVKIPEDTNLELGVIVASQRLLKKDVILFFKQEENVIFIKGIKHHLLREEDILAIFK